MKKSSSDGQGQFSKPKIRPRKATVFMSIISMHCLIESRAFKLQRFSTNDSISNISKNAPKFSLQSFPNFYYFTYFDSGKKQP
jgi:hypothetical protein